MRLTQWALWIGVVVGTIAWALALVFGFGEMATAFGISERAGGVALAAVMFAEIAAVVVAGLVAVRRRVTNPARSIGLVASVICICVTIDWGWIVFGVFHQLL